MGTVEIAGCMHLEQLYHKIHLFFLFLHLPFERSYLRLFYWYICYPESKELIVISSSCDEGIAAVYSIQALNSLVIFLFNSKFCTSICSIIHAPLPLYMRNINFNL